MSSRNSLGREGLDDFWLCISIFHSVVELRSRLSENTEFERETCLRKEIYLYRFLSSVVDHLRHFSQDCSFSSRSLYRSCPRYMTHCHSTPFE